MAGYLDHAKEEEAAWQSGSLGLLHRIHGSSDSPDFSWHESRSCSECSHEGSRSIEFLLLTDDSKVMTPHPLQPYTLKLTTLPTIGLLRATKFHCRFSKEGTIEAASHRCCKGAVLDRLHL